MKIYQGNQSIVSACVFVNITNTTHSVVRLLCLLNEIKGKKKII